MILTRVANFFSTSKLVPSDVDTSLDDIATQLGGTGFPGGVESVHPGNLDQGNVVDGAGFDNAQLAEPNAPYVLKAIIPAGQTTNYYKLLFAGRPGVAMDAYRMVLVLGSKQSSLLLGGTVELVVNGVATGQILGLPVSGAAVGARVAADVAVSLYPDDEVVFDVSTMTFAGGTSGVIEIALHCLAKHVG